MPDLPADFSAALADRYHVERELGRGGMATVYLTRDLKHNRYVALKVLTAELASALGSDRFLREIAIAASLNHPHIMKLLDSGEAAGALFYVMPFVEGESLRHRLIREGQLSVEDALHIAREVADALSYAHALGVIHRDIKPENILLEAGHAVVADFGIARAIDQAGGEQITRTGIVVGTPAYMSPEQAAGTRTLDGRSDLYSLGCLLYEMLAGEPPHTGPSMQAVIARRLSEQAPSVRVVRDTVPAMLDRVLSRALARLPADRYPTAAQFAEDLARSARFLSEQDQESESPRRKRTWRPLTPRRWAWVTAAVALAMLALVAARAFITGARRPPASVDAETEVVPGVAVMPFRTVGPGLEYWREGMMQLLSFNLDGVEGLRKIDPITVLNALHGGRADGSGSEDALTAARRVGARYVVSGSVVQLSGAIRISAEVHEVSTGTASGSVQVDGHPDSVTALVDQLTIELLRLGLLPATARSRPIHLGRTTTTSLPALKAYLEGEREFRQAHWGPALEAYQRALEYDSTFAFAMYRLDQVVGWGFGPDELAQRWRGPLIAQLDRLPDREAMLIRGNLQEGAEGIETLERFTQRYPDDADGWFALGDKQVHFGGIALQPADAFREPFEREISLNPTVAEAYLHLIELAFLRSDSAWTHGLIQDYNANIGVGGQEGCRYETAAALVWGNESSRARAMAVLDTISTAALLECVQSPLTAPPEALRKLSEAYQRNLRSTSDPTTLTVLQWRSLQVSVPSGRIDAARGELDRIAESPAFPGSLRVAAARWNLMLHLSGFSDGPSARRAARMLADESPDPQNTFWLGALAVHDGRWSAAAEARRSLRLQASGRRAVGDSVVAAEAAAFASALDVFERLTRGDRSRILEFENVLRRLPPMGWAVEQPQEFLRYMVGKLLLDWGEYQQAQRYFQSFRPYDYFYTSQAEYHLGQIDEASGRQDSAMVHYRRFVSRWEHADPNLRPIWEDARHALIRLAGK